MSLTTKELRKQVGGEFYQGWKAIRRAVTLLRHNNSPRETILVAEALAQRVTNEADNIDNLLAK